MVTLTKRYVPAAFVVMAEAVVSGRTALTRAPCRLAPLTSRRTGLIECPAHQFGGSTLRTCGPAAGPCARANPALAMSAQKRVATILGAMLGKFNLMTRL